MANNKCYIGSSFDINQRLCSHKGLLIRGSHPNKYLQSAWDKYGSEGFIFERILICNERDLLLFEQRAIDVLMSSDRRYGYNLRKIAASNVGMKRSDETRRKISSIVKGRKLSEEARKNISAAKRGIRRPPHIAKMLSEINKGNTYRLGKKHTAESIALITKNRKGKYTGPRAPEVGTRISLSLKGHKLSEETKAKIGSAQRIHQQKLRNASASKDQAAI